MIRAKFRLDSEKKNYWNGDNKTFEFSAVCDDTTPENKAFYKYTPMGKLELTCNNPAVIEELKLGRVFYLDFTLAEEAPVRN